jgi:hypothetical protein
MRADALIGPIMEKIDAAREAPAPAPIDEYLIEEEPPEFRIQEVSVGIIGEIDYVKEE